MEYMEDESNKGYENRAYGKKADEVYNNKEGNDVLRAAWNLFGLTGSIDEYMFFKEIQRIKSDEIR